MINKESVNKARSLYYGFLSKMFVFSTQNDRFSGMNDVLDIMIENPLDENSAEALKELKDVFEKEGVVSLIQEYDDLFHNPSYTVIRNTASYYDEGVESGKKQLEVKNFLAKTRIRRNEKIFKENEDSVGFIFTFMHELVEMIMQGQKEYDTLQHCLFTEIINPFIDEFIVHVYEHPKAHAYRSVAIVLNAFMAFERLYFDVAKPPYKEVKRVEKPVEVISGAEARRRAENKPKETPKKRQKRLFERSNHEGLLKKAEAFLNNPLRGRGINLDKEHCMDESRRGFVKKAAVAGALTAAGVVTAQAATAKSSGSNGVVVGKSKKKEITYKKTQAWEDYYKSAL